jgi:hypothetical protein
MEGMCVLINQNGKAAEKVQKAIQLHHPLSLSDSIYLSLMIF